MVYLMLVNTFLIFYYSYNNLYIIQQVGYRISEYKNYIFTRNNCFYYALGAIGLTCGALSYVYDSFTFAAVFIGYCLPNLAVSVYYLLCGENYVVLTARAKRLALTLVAVALLLQIPIFYVDKLYVFYVGLILFTPIPLTIAMLLVLPVEKLIQQSYKRQAKELIAKVPIRIAVTGSYGKTSQKLILAAMLSKKYKTKTTPGNYNTPMGICLASKNLEEDTQVFIAEMGARRVGDIEELMKLVEPQIGVLTGIACQHVETFGNIQNIISEKSKVYTMLASDGFAVLNTTDENARKCSEGAACDCYEMNGNQLIEDYKEQDGYFTFTLNIEEKLELKTKLLGRHNAENIAVAAIVAIRLGVRYEDIQQATSELLPFEHRQSYTVMNGIRIIDDSYNVSIAGIKAGLATLNSFEGRKLVATSGIPELGKLSRSVNTQLGEMLSKLDVVILVGEKYVGYIMKGLLESGFDQKNIYQVKNAEQSQSVYKQLLTKGDNLLITGDLPYKYEMR